MSDDKAKLAAMLREKGFVVNEPIGKGAFGVVYRITHAQTGTSFAAKVLNLRAIKMSSGASTELEKKQNQNGVNFMERILREVHVLQQLRHPNIVRLYMTLRTENSLVLIMEFVLGIELFDRIIATSGLPEPVAKGIFLQLCLALRYMHNKGIIHRDVKPENILFFGSSDSNSASGLFSDAEKSDSVNAAEAAGASENLPSNLPPDARIKLIDFGLSKVFGQSTSPDSFVGTPKYLAPEVVCLGNILQQRRQTQAHPQQGFTEGETVPTIGPPSDCYSAGVVLHVMLGACFPQFEVIDGHEQLVFKDPRITKASTEAKDLISKLMKFDPTQRLTMNGTLAHPWLKEPLRIHVAKMNRDSQMDLLPIKFKTALSFEEFKSDLGLKNDEDDLMDDDEQQLKQLIPQSPETSIIAGGPTPIRRFRQNLLNQPHHAANGFSPYNVVAPQGPLFLRQPTFTVPTTAAAAFPIQHGVKRSASRMLSQDNNSAEQDAIIERKKERDILMLPRPLPLMLQSTPAVPAVDETIATAAPQEMKKGVENSTKNESTNLSPSDSESSIESIQAGGLRTLTPTAPSAAANQFYVIDPDSQQFNVMDPEALLQLQLQIDASFADAYRIHSGKNPEVAAKIRQNAVSSRDLKMKSLALLTKLKHTANSIIQMFPDMELALAENEIGMLTTSFNTIKFWIATLKQESQSLLEKNVQLISGVHECIEMTKASTRSPLFELPRGVEEDSKNIQSTHQSMTRFAIQDQSPLPPLPPPKAQEQILLSDGAAAIPPLKQKSRQISGEPSQEVVAFVERMIEAANSGEHLKQSDVLEFAGPLIQKIDLRTRLGQIYRDHQNELERAFIVLQQIDKLLQKHTQFWTQMELAVEVLMQRCNHVESMTNFIRNPRLKTRFQERLTEYSMMWEKVSQIIQSFENRR